MNWHLFNRPIDNPLGKLMVVVLILALLPATLVPHLIARAFGGDGFWKYGRMYEPGPFWTLASNVAAYGLLFLVIL